MLDGADARWTPPDATPDTSTALLAEVRRQRDQLEATVADLRGRLNAQEQAEAELRRLLALALQTRVLPEPRDETVSRDTISRPWWAALLWWWR